MSLRGPVMAALLIVALSLTSAARAQTDFCPANAVADTAVACLGCSKTRSCAADPRCSRARCCVARCWPACGVQAGDCFGVDCACDDGAETIPWEIVVVALGALGSGAIIAAILRRRRRKAGAGSAPPSGAGEAADERGPGRSFHYVLQVSAPRLTLSPRKAEQLEVSAWRVDDRGRVSPATEARIEVGAHPDDGLLELSSDGLTWRKELTLRVDRARGAVVARQTTTEAIEVPADQSTVISQELRIVAEALDSKLEHRVPVDVELSRWFKLCAAAKSGWIWNKPDMERETHLRVNRATLWRDFKHAIAAYDAGEGPPTRMEHVHAKDNADCVDAGIFLFAHNPGKRRGARYYLTPPDEIGDVEKNINTWIQKGRYDAPVKAPEMTEAGLAVDLLRDWADRKRPLTPGDVLRHALRHTSGELTGALLLAHNTLRALARGEGDALGTGLTSHRHLFDEVFEPMRSGLRCIDGTDEERAAGKLAAGRPAGGPPLGTKFELGLAADNAGCWYHLFGTAFYEAYSAERTSLGNTDGWGDFGNRLEQWYREYSPNSWQDPDYEKYCFNIWGIWLARQLMKEHG